MGVRLVVSCRPAVRKAAICAQLCLAHHVLDRFGNSTVTPALCIG